MEDNSKAYTVVNLLIVDILTIVFVTLKLCGVIDWSWWWVLSPVWINFALGVFTLIISALLYIFYRD